MQNRIQGAAAGLLLLLFTAFIMPVMAEGVPVPSLTVGYNGKTQQATRGSFEWDNGKDAVNASTPAPLEIERTLSFFTRQTGVNSLGFTFSYRPKSIVVNRWNSNDRGNLGAVPVAETLTGGTVMLPGDNASYIYEIVAQWEEGTVSYAFETGAHMETISPIDRLPNPYTAEQAARNGDVVLSLQGIENGEKLELFRSKVEHQAVGEVRITAFTKDGGPRVYDLRFDGRKLRCVADFSRDAASSEENRKVTVAYYDQISFAQQATGNGAVTQVKLGSKKNPRDILLGNFPTPGGSLRLEQPIYGRSTAELQLEIINTGTGTLGYDAVYRVERLGAQGWQEVKPAGELTFPNWGGAIAPGKSAMQMIDLNAYYPKKSISEGTYRVVKKLSYGGESHQASAEFEIGKPWGVLFLDDPLEIFATIGTGKKETTVQLTRKGKYEGSSPLIYASTQLAQLNGKPSVGSVGTTQKSIILDVAYENGGDRITIYDNGRVQTMDGLYDSGDLTLYDRLELCVEAALKAAGNTK